MATTPDNLARSEAAAVTIDGAVVQPPSPARGYAAVFAGKLRAALQSLGPGLVTGASDDDPSGIATYSQVGAQFGYGMLWTMVLSYPLMAAIQEISARVGRVTGCGISANLRRCYPRWLLQGVIALVLVANIFNLGADIGAMGAAAQLLLPATTWFYILLFGIASLLLQVLVPYTSYVKYLKWLTVSLFAYVATAFFVQIPWPLVLHATFVPRLTWSKDYLTGLIAVLGTTISPYLFFWQASQEAEEVKNNRGEKALKRAPTRLPSSWDAFALTPIWGWPSPTSSPSLSSSPPRPPCMLMAQLTSPPRRKPHRPCGPLLDTGPPVCSPAGLSARACWPFRFWPVLPLTPWVKPSNGHPAWKRNPPRPPAST